MAQGREDVSCVPRAGEQARRRGDLRTCCRPQWIEQQ